jgi:transcriptional regulator with XRE-family HTH domain
MADISDALRNDLQKPEFSEGYAESFLDSFIATQLKVLREQNGWNQTQLAQRMGKKQTVISRSENVNYSAWNISTLKQYARAFRLRLRVSFETYGSLIDDVANFGRENLQRTPRESDPVLKNPAAKRGPYVEVAGPHGPIRSVAGTRAYPWPNGNENVGGTAQEKAWLNGNNSLTPTIAGCARSQGSALEGAA